MVASVPFTAPMLDSLRCTAGLLSTHFSTQIEGNQLTQAQIRVSGEGISPGRERGEAEVRDHFPAHYGAARLGRWQVDRRGGLHDPRAGDDREGKVPRRRLTDAPESIVAEQAGNSLTPN